MRLDQARARLGARSGEFLGLLIAGDLLFIALHLLHGYSTRFSDLGFSDPGFSLGKDRGFGEIFQYLKMFGIVLLLLGISSRAGRLSYLSWSGLFLYFLIDDSFQLHERVGRVIAVRLGYTPGLSLRAKDFGELTVVVAAGLFFATVVALAWWRGGDDFRRVSKHLAMLVGLVVLFGVVLDMIHFMVKTPAVAAGLGIVEEGGEMVAMSLACWYTYTLFLGRDRSRGSG